LWGNRMGGNGVGGTESETVQIKTGGAREENWGVQEPGCNKRKPSAPKKKGEKTKTFGVTVWGTEATSRKTRSPPTRGKKAV